MKHDIAAHSWGVQMDVALIRDGSPLRAVDLIRALREGRAAFAATDKMSASMLFHEDCFEFGHVAGAFNKEDFEWLLGRMRFEMKRRGINKWKRGGRKGWSRFLRLKGLN